ncbi:MAG: hypothetical protein ACLFMM_06480 [Methanohalobium sp.]|uniref:DUF7287 family protein n=1 Tax=Methanohalobium sp. TaxID=2837493 RepID=UPI00397C2AFC
MKRKNEFDDDRAQLTLDYLIAIIFFIFAVFFVFQYSPGLFTPMQSNSNEVTLIADRTTTMLVENTLSDNNESTTNFVDKNKIDDFFNNSSEYHDKLGLNGSYFNYNLNVTLKNNTSIMRSTGDPLPSHGNIGQTKRVVIFRGDDNNLNSRMLSVRIW